MITTTVKLMEIRLLQFFQEIFPLGFAHCYAEHWMPALMLLSPVLRCVEVPSELHYHTGTGN